MRGVVKCAVGALVVSGMIGCGGHKGGGSGTAAGGAGTDDCAEVAPTHAHTPSSVALFDAHGHQMPSWDQATLDAVVADGGLTGMVLLGPADTSAIQQAAPDTYVGCVFVDVVDGEVTAQDTAQLKSALAAGAGCIGEVKVRHFASGPNPHDIDFEADNPYLTAVYGLARDHGVPVNVHFDYSEGQMDSFERALEQSRDPTKGNTHIIWAHMGDAPAAAIDGLLDRHANLYVDISSRNPLCTFTDRLASLEEQRLDDGTYTLKPEWKALFEDHPDRFLFGTDIGPGDRHQSMAALVDYYRIILGQLPLEAQEKIGATNALTLFGKTP